MLQQYNVAAFAKVNLSLDVVRKREDGYHDLKMVMQSIDLCDDIHLEITDTKKIEISTNLHFLPNNDKNIAYRAAALFYEKTGMEFTGLKIAIEKRIPVGAGLGGGSADGGAVLKGLCKLYEIEVDGEVLQQWGLLIGADVPFCIQGGTALAEGVGEILSDLPPLADCHILLVKPPFAISTAWVFSKLDVKSLRNHPNTEGLIGAICKGDIGGVASRLYNVLETVTAKENKVIPQIKSEMIDLGAMGAAMSGSGSTVFALFSDENKARRAYERFKDLYEETFLCRPLKKIME
jgi:4-diphosphocytidyl-2-C-methyl-D-erythritol kinase